MTLAIEKIRIIICASITGLSNKIKSEIGNGYQSSLLRIWES